MAPQPFVPLADGAQVEIIGRIDGQVVENRLWFVDRNPPITAQHIEDLAVGVAAWHTSQILPYLADSWRVLVVRATDWTDDPPPFMHSEFVLQDGGITTGAHSANVAIRVLFKGTSSQTFPSNSNFVPAIPKERVNGNYYDDTIKDQLFEGYVNLIDLAGTFGASPGWRWVITSRQLGNVYRSTQEFSRTDFIRFPSPVISPRRKRLPK